MKSNAGAGRFGTKTLVFATVGVAILVALLVLRDRLSLDYLAQQEQALRQFRLAHPWLVYVIAFCLYVTVTGLSLPGATGLTLVYGWFLGFFPALILVSFASTMGATLAFLLSRYLFRDAIQTRFGDRLKSFNDALDREGAFYLFTLRLIPAVPFFVINAVMGLTSLRTRTFWWVSQVGMLAGTCVYVYAGASIPRLEQLADPSQLRATDFVDVKSFVRLINQASHDPASQQLRQSMGIADQQWVDELAQSSAEVTIDQREKLAEVLNAAIVRPDFSLRSGWAQIYREPKSATEQEKRAAEKELTKTNRTVLVRAFPQHIRPPSRILSTRLLLAFCLLGLFPIAVKRVMQRIKPDSDAKPE